LKQFGLDESDLGYKIGNYLMKRGMWIGYFKKGYKTFKKGECTE
jgi:hypothetical protein